MTLQSLVEDMRKRQSQTLTEFLHDTSEEIVDIPALATIYTR
jgi:hypothetical protein